MSTHQQSRTAVVVASLFLTACGPTIHSSRDEAILIPRGATWAWAPSDATPRADSARPDSARARRRPAVGGDEIVLQRFQRAAAAVLQTKGFHQVDSATNADFLLTVGFGGAGGRVGRGGGAVYGPGYHGGYGPAFFGGGIVSIGFGRGGRRGYFGGPFGYGAMYVPWGMAYYDPFFWGPWPLMYAGPWPTYYRTPALVAQLRQRSTGELAWRGQVSTDGYGGHRLTQDRVNELAAKLFSKMP